MNEAGSSSKSISIGVLDFQIDDFAGKADDSSLCKDGNSKIFIQKGRLLNEFKIFQDLKEKPLTIQTLNVGDTEIQDSYLYSHEISIISAFSKLIIEPKDKTPLKGVSVFTLKGKPSFPAASSPKPGFVFYSEICGFFYILSVKSHYDFFDSFAYCLVTDGALPNSEMKFTRKYLSYMDFGNKGGFLGYIGPENKKYRDFTLPFDSFESFVRKLGEIKIWWPFRKRPSGGLGADMLDHCSSAGR